MEAQEEEQASIPDKESLTGLLWRPTNQALKQTKVRFRMESPSNPHAFRPVQARQAPQPKPAGHSKKEVRLAFE